MAYIPPSKPTFLGWRKLRLGLLVTKLVASWVPISYFAQGTGIYPMVMGLAGFAIGVHHAAKHPAFGIVCGTCGSTVPLDSRCDNCLSKED
jgi:hypothetical protein